MRKKAKYLHDAPNEALLPGAEQHYQYLRNTQQSRQQQSPQSPTYPIDQSISDVYVPRQLTAQIPLYSRPSTADQLPLTDALINSTYASQVSPVVAQFQDSSSLQTSMADLVQSINPVGSVADSGTMQDFAGNLFDGPDLSQYNFDPASFNFGNHYGALEFGMLGQMAIGAGETPPSDHAVPLGRNDSIISNTGSIPSAYVDSSAATGYIFSQDQSMSNWQTPTQTQSNLRTRPTTSFSRKAQEQPNAFSIGTSSAFASPTSDMSPAVGKPVDEIPSKALFGQSSTSDSRPNTQHGRPITNSHRQSTQGTVSTRTLPTRRRGDPSQVYQTITEPYSYTTGFHILTAFLQDRFTTQQTVRIAKSLASIRPSFLAGTKSLGNEDLIFMEKCFQRTLWEYEDFISATGTPTIVCRRTGEVVAAGKEFSILTGWKRDVLLGLEANLNINRGTTTNNTNTTTTTTSSRGAATPKLPEGVLEVSTRPQPVFLAELLDDDSVFQFYEDFARLAFGDSHGTITTRCKLLKYRTKDYHQVPRANTNVNVPVDETLKSIGKRKRGGTGNRRGEDVAGEARIEELGDKDGKVECSCCWMVKRDVFDLPMMIVMNVSIGQSIRLERLLTGSIVLAMYMIHQAATHTNNDFPGRSITMASLVGGSRPIHKWHYHIAGNNTKRVYASYAKEQSAV